MIVAQAPALLASAKRLHEEIYEVRCALAFVGTCVSGLPTDQTREITGVSAMAITSGDSRDAVEWADALAALKVDPEAPLPL